MEGVRGVFYGILWGSGPDCSRALRKALETSVGYLTLNFMHILSKKYIQSFF